MDNTLRELNILVQRVKADNSLRYKKKVIEKYGQGLAPLLSVIYATDSPFYMTSKAIREYTLPKPFPAIKYEESHNIYEILNKLKNKIWSGAYAKNQVISYIGQNPGYEELVYNIIDKDLKCGIGVKTINSVWPGYIFDFGKNVPLANTYKKGLADFDKEEWYASRKFDGVRCLCFIDSDSISFFSRNGKEFFTLDRLRDDLDKILTPYYRKKRTVVDGELCIVDEDGNETSHL